MYTNDIIFSYFLFYISIYNLNLNSFLFLLLLFNNNIKNIINLQYINYSNYFKLIFTFTVLSISGIPPFLFFFNKLNIFFFLTLIDFKVTIFFYIIFFISIYFYISIIRHSLVPEKSKINIFIKYLNYSNYYCLYILLLIMFLNIFGIIFADDLFLWFLFVSFVH